MDDEVWVERDGQDYQRKETAAPPEPKMGFEERAAQVQASLGDDLWEMHAAACKIVEFTGGRDFQEYQASDVLRAAVASMLGVIAEAYTRITQQPGDCAARLAAPELAELSERIRSGASIPSAEMWRFVREVLPATLARTTTELEAWHAG